MIWDISVLEYLQMGGWVMTPLVLLTVLLSVLIVERTLFFRAMENSDLTPDSLIESLQKPASARPHGTGLYGELLRRFSEAAGHYGRIDRRVVDEVGRSVYPELKKHLLNIGALTAAAPLLGLLGTVSGMVTTFNVMNIFGTGNAKAMSGGISEALITTQFGLVVAIIGMYISLLLNRRSQKLEKTVDEISIHIIRKFKL